MLAVSSTEALYYLAAATTPGSPLPLHTLSENVSAIRTILDKVLSIDIPSDPLSPLIHIHVKQSSSSSSSSSVVLTRQEQTRLLQDVTDEALNNGVLITRMQRVWHQEAVEHRPSIKICVSAGLTKKECEKAATIVKNALVKVLGKKR